MGTFRKITVDNQDFLWKYTFDDSDYQIASGLVIKGADKKGKLVIYFCTGLGDFGYCPFNKGVSAVYQGEPVILNLNQPRFVAELISYALNQLQIDYISGTKELYNGIEMLHALGYEFDYEKTWEKLYFHF